MLFYFVVSLLLVSCAAQSGPCPDGYTKELSSTCLKLSTSSDDHAQVSSLCQGEGANLVTIDTPQKLDEVHGAIDTNNEYYIGVNFDAGTGFWTLPDGTVTTYFPWDTTITHGANDFCVKMDKLAKAWKPTTCNAVLNFICEKDKNPACEDGWEHDTVNSMCLRAHHKYRMTFDDAKAECESKNAKLATVLTDQATMELALGRIVHYDHFWIGVHKPTTPGAFVDIDGLTPAALPFKSGRPKATSTNYCVTVKKTSEEPMWFDKNCSTKRFYICQKPSAY